MNHFKTHILTLALFLLALTTVNAEIRISTVQCICGPSSPGGVTIIATGTAGPFTFQWSGPDGYTSTEQNPADISVPGLYEVAVTNAYGCAVTLTTEVGECPVLDPLLLSPTPACTGASNGVITLTEITTGTAPYTYAWSTGATTDFINGLAPGEYCLIVTDASGCTAEACATITSEQALDLDAQITNVCGEDHNGSIVLAVSGGSGEYEYDWNTDDLDGTVENLAPGIYNVTVTDEDACAITGSFEIIANTPPIIASAQITVATCATAGDGAIALSVSGGAAPYAYAWSHGPTTASVQNLDGAEYCVTVTDANGCEVMACYTTLPTTSQDAAPYVKRVRMFAVPLSGGSETLIYDGEWVTTAAGCIFFTGGTLEISQPLMTAIATGQRKLRVEAEASEAMEEMLVGGHFFILDNMQFQSPVLWHRTISENAFAAAVTNNTLFEEFVFYGIDLNGNPLFDLHATSQSQDLCIDIPRLQPNCSWAPVFTSLCAPLGGLSNELLDILLPCPGGAADGSICIPPNTFHNYPVVYQWQNGSSEACIPGLLEGVDYCVTVTELVCMQSTMHCIIGLGAVGPVSVVLSSSQSACPNGGTNGRLQVTASGGRAPYSYVWNNGTAGAINTGLSAGACHSVTVTDACGQTAVQCFNLPNYAAVAINGSTITPTSCVNGMNGRIQLSLTGGVTPMTFQWANTDGPIPQPIPSASLNNIATGTYWVTITDACGSPTTGGPFVVGTNYTPMATFGNNISDACGIAATGSIKFTRTGGTAPFVFNWSGPNGPMPPTHVPILNNLISGNYSVTRTDACDETLVRNFVVGATAASTAIQVNTTDITHICEPGGTGAINISASTTSGTLTYVWSTGATTEDVSGLSAGIHSVTISNGNCALTNFFNVEEPQWELAGESAPAYCNNENGSADLIITGNAGNLSFLWNTGETTQNISGVAAGTYCVTPMPIAAAFTEVRAAIPIDSIRMELTGILDVGQEYLELAAANNLTVLGSGTPMLTLVSNGPTTTFAHFEAALSAIRYHNNAPVPTYGQREVHAQAFAVFYRSMPATALLPLSNENLRLNAAVTPPSCFGGANGSVLANGIGGLAPYSFQWAGGQTGPALNNLAAGAYPVILTDALGCYRLDTVSVTQPELLQASISANTPFACGPEGILTVTGTGGTLPYTAVLWNDGNTETIRDSLAAGSYAVTLTDANGCTANTVFQLAGAPIVQVFVGGANFCKGETYTIDNVTYTSDTTLCTTFTHPVTGCDSISCFTLTFFDTVRVLTLRQICVGETTIVYGIPVTRDTTICRVFETYLGCDSTRCIQVEVLRREGQTAASICEGETYLFGGNALSAAGQYSRTIPMPSGCDSTVLLTLTVLPAPVPQLSTEGSFCNGGFVRISAGAFPAYQWSNGATTATIEVQAPGLYSVTVSDANGCTASSSLDISADARIEFAYSATSPDCFGEASGALRVDTAYGGQSPYRYSLNESAFQTQTLFSNLSAGSYRLRVEDANSCGAEALVEVPSPPVLFLDAGEDRVIRPGDTIQLQVITNLLPGQNLQWRPPLGLACDTCAVTPAFPTETTLYVVALSDANGCSVRDEVWVRVDRRGGLYIPNAFSPNGDGINDVFFANTDASVRRIPSLRIFDRWGALVFERKDSPPNDPAAGWDGSIGSKPAAAGVYVYAIEIERADGAAERYSGEVTLVR